MVAVELCTAEKKWIGTKSMAKEYDFNESYDILTEWRNGSDSLKSILQIAYSDMMADEVRSQIDYVEDPLFKEAVGKAFLLMSGMLGSLLDKEPEIHGTAIANFAGLVGHNLMSDARGEFQGATRFNKDGTERSEYELRFDPNEN